MVDLVGEKRSGLDESLNESLRVPVDLIVLNLSFSTTEENLKTFFEQFGEVQYVEVCLWTDYKVCLSQKQVLGKFFEHDFLLFYRL